MNCNICLREVYFDDDIEKCSRCFLKEIREDLDQISGKLEKDKEMLRNIKKDMRDNNYKIHNKIGNDNKKRKYL